MKKNARVIAPLVLVVDDAPVMRAIVESFVRKIGCETMTASGGLEALALFESRRPDIVLLDLVMPDMEGTEVAQRMREMRKDDWIPIIYLSAVEEDAAKVKALRSGGDDFISKPVNYVMLEAKIQVFLRLSAMQRELKLFHQRATRETALAAHVISYMSSTAQDPPELKRFERAAAVVSGDILLSARAPNDALVLMMADSTGHGLASAICLQPAVGIFLTMVAKGFGLGAIAREINARLREALPGGQMVAAALVSVDPRYNTMEIWNGGMPDVLVLNERGAIVRLFPSQHPPLGALRSERFNDATEALSVDEAMWMLLYSDGIPEAESPTGVPLGEDGMAACFAGHRPDQGFVRLIAQLDEHLGRNGMAHDDLTAALLAMPVGLPELPVEPIAPTSRRVHHPAWQVTLRFGPEQLRTVEIAPAVLSCLAPMQLRTIQLNEVLLIASEIFLNALDHGVLGLSSGLKSGPDGFKLYFEERRKRLATLTTGEIELQLRWEPSESDHSLYIAVRDSGPGFDHVGMEQKRVAGHGYHGRGIDLIRHLCASFHYVGSGNQVEATYLL